MPSSDNAVFKYFAYGSNLFLKRIHINNPTAVRKDIGKLKNYRLDFNTYSTNWNGAVATIVPDANKTVWGAIYDIDMSNLPDLDRQEGVPNFYIPFYIDIETINHGIVKCRTYTQVNNPNDYIPPADLPDERKPSLTYLQTIIEGAMECNLPIEYLRFLTEYPNNGKLANDFIREQLDLRNHTAIFGDTLTMTKK